MIYEFIFYTGYGYRSVDSHTVRGYPLSINADNDEEAIQKLVKKIPRVLRYNDAFNSNKCGVLKGKLKGVCFIEEKIIKYAGDKIYIAPQAFGIEPYESIITDTEYLNGEWVCRNIFNGIYPTYEAYAKYVYEYMNHPAFGETAEQRLNKYYYTLKGI